MIRRPVAARPNPPWSNSLLARYWDRLARVAGPEMMPETTRTRGPIGIKAREYGTGAYGVALPTRRPGWVLKLTTDASEAQFASAALAHEPWPAGVVRYHAAVALPATRQGRKVFALWREEASDLELFWSPMETEELRAFTELTKLALTPAYQAIARSDGVATRRAVARAAGTFARRVDPAVTSDPDALFDALNDAGREGLVTQAGYGLAAAREIARAWQQHPLAGDIAAAMLVYDSHKIYLADVHYDNLGVVRRGRSEVVAIRDPGRAIFLAPSATKIHVRALPRAPGSKATV